MTHVETTDLDPLMQGQAQDIGPPERPSPQARVAASRAALQRWVDHTYHPERLTADEAQLAAEESGSVPSEDEPAWLGLLVDSLSDVPVASIAVRYLRRWWARHPLRATAEFAGAAGHELLQPTAARHPWLLLGGAVIAGAALTRLRPWRWVSGSAMLASLLPPISLASILTSVTTLMHGMNPDGPHDPDTASNEAPQATAAADASEPSQAQSQAAGDERVAVAA